MNEQELRDQTLYLCYGELESMQRKAKALLCAFNALRCDYSDWFHNQSRSFLVAVKSVQVSMGGLVPQELRSLRQLNHLLDVANVCVRSGRHVIGAERIQPFLDFLSRYHNLLDDFDRTVLPGVKALVPRAGSAERIKKEIEDLRGTLGVRLSEDFDFSELHNERDNLYTYRLSVADGVFHGLVAFLPGLLKLSAKLCYLVRNLSVI